MTWISPREVVSVDYFDINKKYIFTLKNGKTAEPDPVFMEKYIEAKVDMYWLWLELMLGVVNQRYEKKKLEELRMKQNISLVYPYLIPVTMV